MHPSHFICGGGVQVLLATNLFCRAEPGSGSTSRLLEAKFQIGNSSHFSIELKCRHDDQLNTKICKVRHSGTHHAQARTIQLTEKKIRDLFSVQFFGVLHFDFLDKRIAFLDQELDLPDKFTYIGQDEIRVGNILVTSVEHSKVCQGLDMYAFETRDLSKPMPDWHEQPEHLPALRENYGTKASFPIPTNFFYDFYYPMREDGSNSDGLDNRIIFDIRVSGQTFRDIKLNFTSEARKKTVIAVQLDSGANKIRLFGYEPDDDWIGKEESHFYSSVGHNLKNFRVSISSAPDFLLAEATVSARGETIFTTKRTMKHRVIDNVRLRSDTAIFYDVQMTSLSDVVVTTCNFRPFKLEDLEDRVPYHSECYKERNILCQKPPQDIKEEAQIPDELKEEFVWTESFVNTNVTVIPLPLKVAVPVDEDDVIVEDIEPFQWCIVGITAASTTMFITIVALNCIRGGL
uniref:Uncharacterized protein n=1 Tax=Caenorhabditis japonica TaxID=281687 RepID=A0A8R1IBL3_CAEJA